ncbi:MAG: M1 family aminopeptidase [Bryobacteraceae bacterium]
MIRFAVLILAASTAFAAGEEAGSAAAAAKAILNSGLDAQECYRIRDLVFNKEDIRFYLTDGYLIFGKSIDGRRMSAVFSADVDGGDAEVILFPPHRSERLSLAAFTGSPNLDEHITAAVFLFSDGTGEQLLQQVQAGTPKKSEEMGLLLADKWYSVVKNLSGSLEIRLVQDHLARGANRDGFFYATMSGKTLKNFDLFYEPRAREQITVGQLAKRDNRDYFDVWTSFLARPWRTQGRPLYTEDLPVTDIQIEATLQPNLHMNVVTRMTLLPGKPIDAAIAFDISHRMTVTAAKVDGEPAEVFMRDSLRANAIRGSENEIFLVIAPHPLAGGKPHQIEFTHEGDVIASAGNGVYYVGSRGNWYPNHGNGFARYDLSFRYPKALNLITTGDVSEEVVDGEWRVTKRKIASPIRFAGFNLGQYEKTSVTRGGTEVDVYANRKVELALQPKQDLVIMPQPWTRAGRRPPDIQSLGGIGPALPNPTARLQQLANEISAAMEFMTASFGPPPLKTLTVSPIPGNFGQGFPGLLYLSTLSYLNPSERPAEQRKPAQVMFYSELLHAHEAAHQWWGNMVTSANYQDDWLMESLANYSALLFLEKKKGRKLVEEALAEYKTHLLDKGADGRTLESSGPIIWGLRLSSSQAPAAYRVITYEKGSWIMHMLRGRMGDEAFLKMLSELARRYRYQTISTEQFRSLAAEFTPPKSTDPKLENFFEQWVYGTGVPTLKMDFNTTGRPPAVKVRGTITQTDVDDDFSAYVPVEILLPGKQTATRWVKTSSEPVPFQIDLKQMPARVTLDPAGSILAIRK